MKIMKVIVAELCVAGLLLVWSMAATAAEKAADNYRTYCTQCHGVEGDGKGINVRDMSVQPRDHTDAKEMSTRSDADLFKVIKDGGVAINKSVLMPPWGDILSDEEIHGLVAHLREMCQCSYGR
jgi:cytochrome c oxidase cbb3-type subunit 3